MIQLSHLGEDLISELLARSDKSRKLVCSKIFEDVGTFVLVPELRLNSCGSLYFDGAHKIDISVLDTDNHICYPIEAKLGLDRLSKNEFNKRFLGRCETSHGNSRVKGNMISVLERKLPNECLASDLSVSFEGQSYALTKRWGLICRKVVLNNWLLKGKPELSTNCNVISFESLVSSYGGEKEFNRLVADIVSFNFYEKWECHA